MTTLHVVVGLGTQEIFQEIWELNKEKVGTEEMYNELLLTTDEKRRTVLHVAAAYHERNILQEILDCAKEKISTEEIKKGIISQTHRNDGIACGSRGPRRTDIEGNTEVAKREINNIPSGIPTKTL